MIVVTVFLSTLNQIELSQRPYPLQYERKWNTSFLSACGIHTVQARRCADTSCVQLQESAVAILKIYLQNR